METPKPITVNAPQELIIRRSTIFRDRVTPLELKCKCCISQKESSNSERLLQNEVSFLSEVRALLSEHKGKMSL